MGIVSTQRGTITIGAASSSNTAAITSVNTAKTQLRILGYSSTADDAAAAPRIALTSSVLLTASRAGTTGDTVVSYELTEFS